MFWANRKTQLHHWASSSLLSRLGTNFFLAGQRGNGEEPEKCALYNCVARMRPKEDSGPLLDGGTMEWSAIVSDKLFPRARYTRTKWTRRVLCGTRDQQISRHEEHGRVQAEVWPFKRDSWSCHAAPDNGQRRDEERARGRAIPAACRAQCIYMRRPRPPHTSLRSEPTPAAKRGHTGRRCVAEIPKSYEAVWGRARQQSFATARPTRYIRKPRRGSSNSSAGSSRSEPETLRVSIV